MRKSVFVAGILWMLASVGCSASVREHFFDPIAMLQMERAKVGDLLHFHSSKVCVIIIAPYVIVGSGTSIQNQFIGLTCKPGERMFRSNIGNLFPELKEVVNPSSESYSMWASVYTMSVRETE